eukprot:TCALIF_13487-PA protein Name:"Protein of unknown function" AED:0.28 eAED:0.28 QI:0/0/0/0.66/1/1/3/0/212
MKVQCAGGDVGGGDVSGMEGEKDDEKLVADRGLQRELLCMDNPTLAQIKPKCESWEGGGANLAALQGKSYVNADRCPSRKPDKPGKWTKSQTAPPRTKIRVCDAYGVTFEAIAIPDTGATDCIVPTRLLQFNGMDIDASEKLFNQAVNGTGIACDGVVDLRLNWLNKSTRVKAFVSPDVYVMILWLVNYDRFENDSKQFPVLERYILIFIRT